MSLHRQLEKYFPVISDERKKLDELEELHRRFLEVERNVVEIVQVTARDNGEELTVNRNKKKLTSGILSFVLAELYEKLTPHGQTLRDECEYLFFLPFCT